MPALKNDFGSFLTFEPLTLCPYDRRLIAVEMLNDEERQWLNAYHARVRNVLTPLLEDEAEQLWLKQATAPI